MKNGRPRVLNTNGKHPLPREEALARAAEISEHVRELVADIIASGFGKLELVVRDHQVATVNKTETWVRGNQRKEIWR